MSAKYVEDWTPFVSSEKCQIFLLNPEIAEDQVANLYNWKLTP